MRYAFLQQLSAEPWFIAEAIHAELLHDSVALALGPGPEADVTKVLAMAFPQRKPVTMEKETGIAHVHVFGPLACNLPPIERATGKTDFAQIHEDIATARAGGASAILLHVDSPGGTVRGTPEAAELIAKTTEQIPVAVHAARAGSAAYYLAAGAQRIFASPSAEVGSIGVLFPRVNLAGALEKAGIKAETITNTAGDLKSMSSTGELTAVQREYLKAEADRLFSDFRDHVTAHRDQVTAPSMRGQTFSGQSAVTAGLVDHVGSAADARAWLLGEMANPVRKRAA